MTHSKYLGSDVFLFDFLVDCNPLVLLFEYKPWGHAIPLSVSQSLVPPNSFSNCYRNSLMSLATCNPSHPPRHVVKGLRGLETSKLSNFHSLFLFFPRVIFAQCHLSVFVRLKRPTSDLQWCTLMSLDDTAKHPIGLHDFHAYNCDWQQNHGHGWRRIMSHV